MTNRPERLAHDAFVACAALTPHHEAVVDEVERRTYAQLLDESLRFARALQDAGLERGDRVAIALDNTVSCAVAILGSLLAGGVVTPVSPQTKADKLAFILDDAEASFLVTEGRAATVAAAVAARVPSLRRVYATAADELPLGLEALSHTIAAAAPEPRQSGAIQGDLAALIYTSGTTGKPKGVMLSHGAFAFTTASIAEYLRLDASDRIFSFLPLAFTYGLGQLLLATRLGATLILERSFAYPAKTMRRIRAEEATVLPAVPTVFTTIVGMEHDAPYPSLRRLTNAAAGLPPALHAGLREVFPNADLYRMYGQTECLRVCYLEPELVERKPTSVGRAIPGTECFVLGEDGAPVAPGEVGVLHTRGPHVMLGYWRAPELTAQALRAGRYPSERILCNHDYFTVDEDGDLYFVDRSDDIIKTRGEKVSSVEVENALHDIDGIEQAAVIGVPDELLGAAVRAYVVVREGARLSVAEIIRGCRERLEGYMVPRDVVLVDALPHTESGKVRKKSLAEAFAATH
jgi:acyl-CoA synthetase (AMP-forming)/AMP-acid ligase II